MHRLFSSTTRRSAPVALSDAVTHASSGDVKEVDRLLRASPATACAADKYGFSLLMHACGEGHADVARLLLEARADLNAANSSGDTALHLCASMGHEECVGILLRAGADWTRKTRDGRTAADMARAIGHTSIATRLDRCSRSDPQDQDQLSAAPAPAAEDECEREVPGLSDAPRGHAPSAQADGAPCTASVAAAPQAGADGPRELAYALLDADISTLGQEARDEMATVLEMVLERLRACEPAAESAVVESLQ